MSAEASPSIALPVESIEGRIRNLRDQIAHHDELYYRFAAPEISDTEYDALKQELRALENAHPEIAARLPALPAVGDDRRSGFLKHRHRVPMRSLEKAYSESELKRFYEAVVERAGLENAEFLVEPKVDGMAISLVYEDGVLVKAASRGNGREGDDITANARVIEGLPRELGSGDGSISVPEFVELRGELFVAWDDFREFNRARSQIGEPTFSHPRNLAAGSAKLADPEEVKHRPLSVAIHGYGAYLPESERPSSLSDFYRQAEAWGIPTVEFVRATDGYAALAEGVQDVNARRPLYSFPTDGCVVKLDAVSAQEALGASESAPRWAIACKFGSQRVETRLLAISLQLGRSGRVTPVAELEAVELSGSRIERASLHNPATIQRLGLRVGDAVVVEKAGEIVPAIVGVNLDKRPLDSVAYVFPDRCPSCSSSLVKEVDGASARCVAVSCSGQLAHRIAHFASSGAVGIDGLGPATAQALVDAGLVLDYADLYRLRAEDLLALRGVGSATAEQLIASIERSKNGELWRLLYGLSIPEIGPARAKALARACGNLQGFVSLEPADVEGGGKAAMAGLGGAAGEAVLAYLSDPRNASALESLIELVGKGVAPEEAPR